MNEISIQATHFLPRLISVIILVALTWLVAKIAQYMVLRTADKCKNGKSVSLKSKTIASLAFWATALIMSPFVLGAAGVDTSWLLTIQKYEVQIFANWPVWMIVSLLVAGISFLVQGVPKFFVQLKSSNGASQSETQS